MSQNDFTIANLSFPAFRADLNSALQALASNNSGGSAPSTTFANMWWYDSSNNIMYIRNEDNDAWIKFAELDQTNDKFVLSGTLQLDDGTVSAPALTFNSDTNMGIYRGGTDILKFVTGATDRLTILANGDVGIGTSPSHDLHVKSDGNTKVRFEGNLSSNTSDLLISHSTTGDSGLQFNSNQLNMFTYGDIAFYASTSNISGGYPANERMRIKNTGVNVGIGNTFAHSFNAQANQLVVGTGSGDNGITIYSGSGSGDTGNLFFADGFNASEETRAGISYNHGTDTMNFRTSDTANRIVIDSSGRVGIGMSNPSQKLDVRGTVHLGVSGTSSGDVTGTLSIGNTGTNYMTFIKAINTASTPAILKTRMGFFTLSGVGEEAQHATEKMSITADGGNVGIGNTNPSQKLDVNGSIVASTTSSQGARIERNGTTGGANFDSVLASGSLHFRTGATERSRIIDTGFFKTGNLGGTYRGVTATYHEMLTDKSGDGVATFSMTNASYAGGGFQVVAARTATGDTYKLFEGYSGNGADREFRVDSDGTVHADGSYTGTGADYAEMFEWSDGNITNEDRVGKTVVLDGNQIRLSTSDDAQSSIIGVVSARPVVLGDAQSERWFDKYEMDDFGRHIREEYTQTEWIEEDEDGNKSHKSYETDKIPSDVTVPSDAIVTSTEVDGTTPLTRRKLNSSYDSSQTYIPREQRKEFSPIGLVGKLRVEVGQTVGDRWIKMREISDTVHEYLVR